MAVSGGTRREDLHDVVMRPDPRQDELRGLHWTDLDLSGRTLTTGRSVSTANGFERGPTKTGEEGTVPVCLVDAHRRYHNHDLRHTAVPLMLEERVPVNLVSEVLRHSDTAMTLRRCAHGLPDMQEIASDAMEEYAS